MPPGRFAIIGAALFGAFLFCGHSSAMDTQDRSPVIAFVIESLERYPRSEARDVYKLLYQAYHGAEHAFTDRDSAREWLLAEWEGLNPALESDPAPMVEPIFIEGVTPPLYRLNLARAKANGLDPETVLEEFLRTADEFPECYPDEATDLHAAFLAAWTEVGRAVQRGELPITVDDYAAFSSEIEAAGWPPAHHSDAYRQAYDPHYRLVTDPSVFGSSD
jgi:hypothetical protein